MIEENGLFKEFETNLAYHFSEVLNYPFAKPHWIYISLSHKCTYSCQMCGVVKILKGHELSADLVRKTFDEISCWGWDCNIVLTGGEPFLRKDIFELIEHSTKIGLKTEIVSNGALIDQELARKVISSGLANIAISLDGASEVTHDNIRSKGSFKKAIDAVRLLVAEKRKNGYGPQLSIWTTIMRENVTELSDIIPIVKDLGVECLVYHPVIVTQDDMQSASADAPFWVSNGNLGLLREMIDEIVDYQKKNGLVTFLHDPYLWIKYFEGILVKEDWKCNPFVFINIGPDGEMRSCGSAFGNVKEMVLDECLVTKEAFQARKLMKICEKACLQTCWAHPDSNSLMDIAHEFLIKLRKDNKNNKKAILRDAFRLLCNYEDILEIYA